MVLEPPTLLLFFPLCFPYSFFFFSPCLNVDMEILFYLNTILTMLGPRVLCKTLSDTAMSFLLYSILTKSAE